MLELIGNQPYERLLGSLLELRLRAGRFILTPISVVVELFLLHVYN